MYGEGELFFTTDDLGSGIPDTPFLVAVVDRRLYFSADDGVHGAELWKSDGTPGGTRLLADIFPGPASSNPINFSRVGAWVYFTADDGVHGREVWALPLACFPKTGGR